MNSTYAIGDLQGCYDDLMRLLDKLDYSSERDKLWFAGDLVNRGGQSLKTLQFIHSLGTRALCVLGNHDLHLLAVAQGVRALNQSDTFVDVLASSQREELLDWLRRQPLIHHDPELNCAMVHAGIYPGWSLPDACGYAEEVHRYLRGDHCTDFLATIYGNQPDRWSEILSGPGRLRFIVNSFTRMRFCGEDGQLDLHHGGPIGSQPQHLRAWFQCPNPLPRSLKVVFGHWAALGPTDTPGFYALDTGCVWGNALTALKLGTGELISVPCRGALRY